MTIVDDRLSKAFALYAPNNSQKEVIFHRKGSIFCICTYKNLLFRGVTRNKQRQHIGTYVVFPGTINPRWIFPDDIKFILNSGNLVKLTKLSSRLVWLLFRAYATTGLPLSTIFPNIKLYAHVDSRKDNINLATFIENILGTTNLDFILYTGVQGIFQKYTAQVMNHVGETLCYAKLSCATLGKYNLRKEAKNLKYLESYSFKYFQHPTLLANTTYSDYKLILQSKPSTEFKKPLLDLTDIHFKALAELFSVTVRHDKSLEMLLSNARNSLRIKSLDKLLTNTAKIITTAIESFLLTNVNYSIPTGFSHGDFSPWNVLTNNSQLYLYDWELGDFRTPYWDILNYVTHKELLINTKGPADILFKINSLFDKIILYTSIIKDHCTMSYNNYVKLFLIDISIYYHNYYYYLVKSNLQIKSLAIHLLLSFTKMLAEYIPEPQHI